MIIIIKQAHPFNCLKSLVSWAARLQKDQLISLVEERVGVQGHSPDTRNCHKAVVFLVPLCEIRA